MIALHDGESGTSVLCGRREHSDGGGPTPKKGTENRERTLARLDLNDPALHGDESVINVLFGRREHRSGGGSRPKKGIENHERKERVPT